MGSNPIPRAFLVDLFENGNIKKSTRCYGRNTGGLSHNQANNINNQTPEKRDKSEREILALINRKTDSITKSCSKSYINTILKNLATNSQENAEKNVKISSLKRQNVI